MENKYYHSLDIDAARRIRTELNIGTGIDAEIVRLAQLEEQIFHYRSSLLSVAERMLKETDEEERFIDELEISRGKIIMSALLDEFECLYEVVHCQDK